jgi:hypothetical protein
MSNDGRIILRFAVAGLAFAGIFCAFFKTEWLAESWAAGWMYWASLVACPGYFLFVMVVAGGELPMPDSVLVWLIIGLVNCLYYASIAVVYVDMRKPRRSVAKI